MSKILLFLLFLIVCDCFCKELVAHIIFSTNQDFLRKYEIKNASDTVVRLGKIRTSCTCADVKYLKSELQFISINDFLEMMDGKLKKQNWIW